MTRLGGLEGLAEKVGVESAICKKRCMLMQR